MLLRIKVYTQECDQDQHTRYQLQALLDRAGPVHPVVYRHHDKAPERRPHGQHHPAQAHEFAQVLILQRRDEHRVAGH